MQLYGKTYATTALSKIISYVDLSFQRKHVSED